MIASNGFLENEVSQFCKEEGVTLADSVKTLGVDLRTRVKKVGSERTSEKKKSGSKLGTVSGTNDSRLDRDGKRVIDAVEDYLEKCAHVIVKVDLVESLPMPENLEVSLRYANYGGNNIFQLFDTTEKPNHLVANRTVEPP